MNAKLTAKQTALLTQIAKQQFSFFDDGLVAGSGIWMNCLTGEAGPDVAANPKGAATVASTLAKKGFLLVSGGAASDYADDSDGAWVELTEAGAAWCAEYNAAAAASAAADDALEATLEVGEDGNYVAPSVTEAAPEAAPAAPAKKTRKAKKAAAVEAPETAETPAPAAAAPETPAESWTVTEWAQDTDDYGVEEYIETKFADGSWTLRRRRNVSGAWRTDFWGQAAGAEKRVFTTSGAAKAARAAGKFVG